MKVRRNMNIFSSFSRAGLICSYRAIDVRIKSVETLLRRIEMIKILLKAQENQVIVHG